MDQIGSSHEMVRVRNQLPRIAAGDSAVLLVGAPRADLEEVARQIHLTSRRAEAPFVVVDCGACTDEELFGSAGSPGALQRSREGTVYLADLDALSMALQVKLARFVDAVEQGELDDPPRLLASSRQNLVSLISRGRFRGDLYYRLCAVTVRLPAA